MAFYARRPGYMCAAVEVLDRIKEAGVDKEEWLRQLREANGFNGGS